MRPHSGPNLPDKDAEWLGRMGQWCNKRKNSGFVTVSLMNQVWVPYMVDFLHLCQRPPDYEIQCRQAGEVHHSAIG